MDYFLRDPACPVASDDVRGLGHVCRLGALLASTVLNDCRSYNRGFPVESVDLPTALVAGPIVGALSHLFWL